MNRSHRSYFLCSIMSVLLFVQTLSSQPVRVSVRSSIEAALQNHASMKVAAERVNGARASYDEAGARLLPKLQLIGRAYKLSDVEQGQIRVPFIPGSPSFSLFETVTHAYAARVQITQPVFNGFRLLEAKDAAEFGLEAAEAERSRDEADLALEVQSVYWSWVQAREAHQVMQKTAEQMKQHEERVMKLLEQGLTTQADVLKIRTRRSDVEVRAIEMRTNASLAMMRLNSLMGNPLDTHLEPEDLPENIRLYEMTGSERDMVVQAIDRRPDLAAVRYKKEAARSAVSVAKAGWYPSIALAAAYDYSNPNQRIIPPSDRFDGTWEVGLSFRWTLWDWMTTTSKAAQTEAVHRQAEAGYQLLVDGVQLEIAQLSRRIRDSKEKLASAKLGVEAAKESYRTTEERFDKGLATSIDVTDARIEVLRAELILTQTATEAALNAAKLRRAIGEVR